MHSRDDVEALARTDPVVHACLRLHHNSKLSFEQALIEAVMSLSRLYTEAQQKMAVLAMYHLPPVTGGHPLYPGEAPPPEPFKVAKRHDVVDCAACSGAGWLGEDGSSPCIECEGSGLVERAEEADGAY